MSVHGGFDFLRVFHFKAVFAAENKAYVADLSAGFGVERGVVEYDDAGFACFEFVYGFAVAVECQHGGIGAAFVVAVELGFCAVIRYLGVGFEVLCGAGAGALGFHFALEAFFVQLDAQFARHVGG